VSGATLAAVGQRRAGLATKLALALGLGACGGCASPNLYTTPRATPVGKFNSVVAPQLVRRLDPRTETFSVLLGARLGLAKRLDLGVRTNFASVGADIKWNAVRTDFFDLALDGGVQVLPETLYVDMPILAGFNLSEDFSLLASTGITLGNGEQPSMNSRETFDDGIRNHPPAGRVLIRGGLGAQLRFAPRFAVVPEFTYLGPLDGGRTGTSEFISVGLGFCFGMHPY
jgi:hypothetical protein